MKKTFCLILVILNLFTLSAFAENSVLTDTQKSDLYNLGIIQGNENGDLMLDKTLTRAEAVKIICVLKGITSYDSKDSVLVAEFPDVSKSHWAYEYILLAKAHEIVEGDENGYFNPEKAVTNEEFIKMLINTIGYGVRAESMGGYPAGYTANASMLGITNGLKLKTNTSAIRKDVSIMICNALDLPLMEKSIESSFGIDNVSYVIFDGENDLPLKTLRTELSKK